MSDNDHPFNPQANPQPGQQQVRLRMDERNRTTTYANAYRTSTTAEEVILDFGFNQTVPAQKLPGDKNTNQPQAEILFEITSRVMMNYYTAKRLALTLGQIVHQHEQQFGEVKLNIQDRLKNPPATRSN